MVSKDYVSLHPEYGGPARGFRCEVEVSLIERGHKIATCQCSKVTRTESGMKIHLLRCHGIKIQGDLFDKTPEAKPKEVPPAQPKLSQAVDEDEPRNDAANHIGRAL